MHDQVLMQYYIKYLKEIRGVSDSSIGHYTQALRRISSFLVEKKQVRESIYEIQDIGNLEIVREFLYNDVEFVDLDERGHRMYSAGLNNYYRFANGDGFANIKKRIQILDAEMPVPEQKIQLVETKNRSSIIKKQSIESAGYVCEYDESHSSFISKSTGQQYMEGHHALPLKYQDKFEHSLDVYANIVCLCPVCHRLMHYGIDSEKEVVANKIYYERADRLAASGLRIGKEDFYKLVI